MTQVSHKWCKKRNMTVQTADMELEKIWYFWIKKSDFGRCVDTSTNEKCTAPPSGASWLCDLSFLQSETTSRMALKWKSMRLSMAGSVARPPSWKRSQRSPSLYILMPICSRESSSSSSAPPRGGSGYSSWMCRRFEQNLFTHQSDGVVHAAVDDLGASADGDAQRAVVPNPTADSVPGLEQNHLDPGTFGQLSINLSIILYITDHSGENNRAGWCGWKTYDDKSI